MEHDKNCDQEYCEAQESEPVCITGHSHEWTRKGMGGLDNNPGVWKRGGTTFIFKSICTHCKVIRTEVEYGFQRDPYQCDEVKYEQYEQCENDN